MAIPLLMAGLAGARAIAPHVTRALVTPSKLGVGLATAENVAQKEMGWNLPNISLNSIIGNGVVDAAYTVTPTASYIADREHALDAERIARNNVLLSKIKKEKK
jgi:hypothetical protein